jgi:hypothetical protein
VRPAHVSKGSMHQGSDGQRAVGLPLLHSKHATLCMVQCHRYKADRLRAALNSSRYAAYVLRGASPRQVCCADVMLSTGWPPKACLQCRWACSSSRKVHIGTIVNFILGS